VNRAQVDFVENPEVSLLDGFRRQSADVIVRDAAAVDDRDEDAFDQIVGGLAVQPMPRFSIVRICRGLP
jgi:hypothetical protein